MKTWRIWFRTIGKCIFGFFKKKIHHSLPFKYLLRQREKKTGWGQLLNEGTINLKMSIKWKTDVQSWILYVQSSFWYHMDEMSQKNVNDLTNNNNKKNQWNNKCFRTRYYFLVSRLNEKIQHFNNEIYQLDHDTRT